MSVSPFSDSMIQADITQLVNAFCGNKAVAFVGAGASIPSGLPSWKEFLSAAIRRAQSSNPNRSFWDRTEAILREGDYLGTAEMLQRGLGGQLEEYVNDAFGLDARPSMIHHAIARLPFSLAVTTNFDRLLEDAYAKIPGVRTWRDPEAVFSAIRRRRFAVIKTHGDLENRPSIILTKTQYRDLTRLNKSFSFCLQTLLALRTFLFVGFSLRDPDISSLMDDARILFGEDFGPHYAVLFEDEVDELFADYLKAAYNIVVLTVPKPPAELSHSDSIKWREKSVAELLNQIGGFVAAKLHGSFAPISLDDPLFNRDAACSALLKEAISLTGSSRGEVCLVEDEVFARIRKAAVFPEQETIGADVNPESVIGRLFLKRKVVDDYIYLSDTRNAADQLRRQGFADAQYKTCDTAILSELAVPILSDGTRVGVLNIESDQLNAYSRGHMQALASIACQIGWAYYETRQRVTSGIHNKYLVQNPSKLHDLMTHSRMFAPRHMHFISYEIDYLHGKLLGHFDSGRLTHVKETSPFEFTFTDRSLATLVLRRRQRVFIRDADAELQLPEEARRLSVDGCKSFDIHGPVFGMPIFTSGNTSAVLVGWTSRVANDPGDPEGPASYDTIFRQCARFAERMHRLSQMIAYDSSKDEVKSPYLSHLSEQLASIDGGAPWNIDELRKNHTRRQQLIKVLLESLIHESVGLYRVRLWRHANSTGTFELMASANLKQWPKEKEWNEYVGKATTDSSDPFCRYTLERYAYDPYARHQDRAMFNQEADKNVDVLRKDPDGSWIVAPIVTLNSWCAHTFPLERTTGGTSYSEPITEPPVAILGFISADMHRPVKKHGKMVPKDSASTGPVSIGESIRRGLAMDIVSDLIEPLMLATV
jgi:GAF domain-containing protein